MFAGLPDMSSLVEKRKEFSEERILGYSPDRVYNVVADLNRYITQHNLLHVTSLSVYIATRSSCRGVRTPSILVKGQRGAMASCPLVSLPC